MTIEPEELRAKVVRFYEMADQGQFPADLFTDDFQFYSPKYGVGRGLQMFGEFGANAGVRQIEHHRETMLILVEGNNVAVEGTTSGTTASGKSWMGGETPAGRYASIFQFNDAGRIERMHIYVDPDFEGSDKAGFRWHRGDAQQW